MKLKIVCDASLVCGHIIDLTESERRTLIERRPDLDNKLIMTCPECNHKCEVTDVREKS